MNRYSDVDFCVIRSGFHVTHYNFEEILSHSKKQSGQVLLCRIEVMKGKKTRVGFKKTLRLHGSGQLVYEIKEKFLEIPTSTLPVHIIFYLVFALKSCLLDCDTHTLEEVGWSVSTSSLRVLIVTQAICCKSFALLV